MNRLLLLFAMFTLLATPTLGQEWVEHGGVEYNCVVLQGIIGDYGGSDLSRSSGEVMTVGELFSVYFPSCPPVADAASVVSNEQEITVDAEAGTSSYTALYSFSSDEAGLQPVLGPVSLSAGIYIFSATTDGFITVSPQSLSGDCGWDISLPVFSLFPSKAADGAESVVEVEKDCDVLLEIGNTNATWMLEINKLS